jgi:hypothetical protein
MLSKSVNSANTNKACMSFYTVGSDGLNPSCSCPRARGRGGQSLSFNGTLPMLITLFNFRFLLLGEMTVALGGVNCGPARIPIIH